MKRLFLLLTLALGLNSCSNIMAEPTMGEPPMMDEPQPEFAVAKSQNTQPLGEKIHYKFPNGTYATIIRIPKRFGSTRILSVDFENLTMYDGDADSNVPGYYYIYAKGVKATSITFRFAQLYKIQNNISEGYVGKETVSYDSSTGEIGIPTFKLNLENQEDPDGLYFDERVKMFVEHFEEVTGEKITTDHQKEILILKTAFTDSIPLWFGKSIATCDNENVLIFINVQRFYTFTGFYATYRSIEFRKTFEHELMHDLFNVNHDPRPTPNIMGTLDYPIFFTDSTYRYNAYARGFDYANQLRICDADETLEDLNLVP